MDAHLGGDVLLRAEVKLSRAEAALLARLLRLGISREVLATRGREEGGPSLETLRVQEVAALVLEGKTFFEATKLAEEAWTDDAEQSRRRAGAEKARVEGELEARIDEGHRRMLRLMKDVREGREDFSEEEIATMKIIMGLAEPSSPEEVRTFLDGSKPFGEDN